MGRSGYAKFCSALSLFVVAHSVHAEDVTVFNVTAASALSGPCYDLLSRRATSNFRMVARLAANTREIQKIEFETAQQFNDRAERALTTLRAAVESKFGEQYVYHSFRVNFPPYDERMGISYQYSADLQKLSVPYLQYDKSFRGTEIFPGDQLLQFGLDRVPVKLVSVETSASTYKGQTVFGAVRNVRASSDNSYYWGMLRLPGWRCWTEKFDFPFELSMTGETAKGMLPFARVLMVGELVESGLGRVMAQARTPTYSRPNDYTEYAHVLMAKPVWAALYDSRSFNIYQAHNISISARSKDTP